jgi:hypothetical protein
VANEISRAVTSMAKRRPAIVSVAEFVITRRNGLNCYGIASTSWQVAIEIERLLEHN